MNNQGGKRKQQLRRLLQLSFIILCLFGLWWVLSSSDGTKIPVKERPPTIDSPSSVEENPDTTPDIENPLSTPDSPKVKKPDPEPAEVKVWWTPPVPEADLLYFPPSIGELDTAENSDTFIHITPDQGSEPTDINFKCPSVKVPKVNTLREITRLPTIAYSIVVHKRPDLLRVWLYLTHDPDNFYMIHVDAKAPEEVYNEFVKLAKEYTNVHINPDRYYTIYYGWSVMWNHISNYMRIKHMNQTRDYYINVSGMEAPIKTRKEIRFFLAEHEPASFVQEYCVISEVRNFWVAWTWAEVKAGLVVVNKEARAIPSGVKLHYGSQYSILHRNIVDWMLDDLRMLHLSYWLRNTKSPEDIYFVTAARNSPYKNSVFTYNNMKYVERNFCCTGFQTSRSTPCSLGVCDMPKINESVTLYLSRVDSIDDPEILQYIVNVLSEREEQETKTGQVQRLPLVKEQVLDPPYATLPRAHSG